MDEFNYESQVDEENRQDSRSQTKFFVCESFQIRYVNTSQVCYQREEEIKDVKVDNFLCYQDGNNLFKVTEIAYEDKVVRIEDKFEVKEIEPKIDHEGNEQKVNSVKNKNKVRIFSQDALTKMNSSARGEKRDKKNIVKNIIKMFMAWLDKKGRAEEKRANREVLDHIKKMLASQNFNNRLIKNIINHESVSKKFIVFLREHANEEIKISKINDKESHFEAIELYTKMLSDYTENIEQGIIYQQSE